MKRSHRIRDFSLGLALAFTCVALGGGVCRAADASQAADPAGCRVGGDTPAATRIADCDAALALSSEPGSRAHELFARAYAKNELEKFDAALVDLNDSVRLNPADPGVLHERAYTLSSLGRYEEALADLDAQLKLTPDAANAYQERAYSDAHLARFQAAYDDWTHMIALAPADAGAVLARARAAMWLGRFDLTRVDLAAAPALATAQNNEQLLKNIAATTEQLALWSTRSAAASGAQGCDLAEKSGDFKAKQLIGDCTAAFLEAKDAHGRASYLTLRSMVWLAQRNDEAAWTRDLQMAVMLDPDFSEWRANLGFAYLQARHSRAALVEFDRAVALKRGDFALAGRARAKCNIGDVAGAFADAKASFEIKPNIIALSLLGEIAIEHFHDPKSAKLYWMGAYHLGDRSDWLRTKLKSVGVDVPDKEPAGQ